MDFSRRHEARLDTRRLAAVAETELVGTAPEERFDRLTRLAAHTLGVPVTFLSLVDHDSDFYKSAHGLPEPLATTRALGGETFCHFTLVSDGVLVVEDARSHPLLSQVPTVESLGVVAYLGVPLLSADGHAIGAFCAVDTAPRSWSESDIDALVALARATLGEIRSQRHPGSHPTREQLYDSLAPVVYALFLRILGDRTAASELLATFMNEVLQGHAATRDDEDSSRAKILHDARKAALAYRDQRGPAVATPARNDHFPISLSEIECRVLSLAYFDGLKIQRIAEIVEAPAEQVRRNLVEAMHKVRDAGHTLTPVRA